MGVVAVVIGVCLAMVGLFAIARSVFGPASAVLLTSGVGYCFGGPPGAAIGLVAGLVLVAIVGVVRFLLELSQEP